MRVDKLYIIYVVVFTLFASGLTFAQNGMNTDYEQYYADPGLDSVMGVDRDIQNEGQYWVDPKLISKIDPDYPISEYDDPRNVTVIIDLYIDEYGQIYDTRVISSVGTAFDRAAVEAVYRWLFEPGLYYGEPHKAVLSVGVSFYKNTIPGSETTEGRTDIFPEGTDIPTFLLFE